MALRRKMGRIMAWCNKTHLAQTRHKPWPESIHDSELLNFAGDGVATNSQLERGLDTPAPGCGQCSLNQARLEPLGQHVPYVMPIGG
jgi:hypothetical protein